MPHISSIQTEVRLRRLEEKLKLIREILGGLVVNAKGELTTKLPYVSITRQGTAWSITDDAQRVEIFEDFDGAVERILARWW